MPRTPLRCPRPPRSDHLSETPPSGSGRHPHPEPPKMARKAARRPCRSSAGRLGLPDSGRKLAPVIEARRPALIRRDS
jgi:hypothetical protein